MFKVQSGPRRRSLVAFSTLTVAEDDDDGNDDDGIIVPTTTPSLPIPPIETLEKKGDPDKGARNPNRYATSAIKRGYFAINRKEFLERSATF